MKEWFDYLFRRLAEATCRLEAKATCAEIDASYRMLQHTGRLDLLLAIHDLQEEINSAQDQEG